MARKGFTHDYSIEQLRAFQRIPAADKLRWLEAMRQLLARALTPARREIMERFRKGDI